MNEKTSCVKGKSQPANYSFAGTAHLFPLMTAQATILAIVFLLNDRPDLSLSSRHFPHWRGDDKTKYNRECFLRLDSVVSVFTLAD